VGGKVEELRRKGFVEKMSFEPVVKERISSLMHGDSCDGGNDELTCVRSDESYVVLMVSRQAKFHVKLITDTG